MRTSEIQALRSDLLTQEELFSAHCSLGSVTLLMGLETPQFSSRIAVSLQGQRGNGDRENTAGQIGSSTERKASVLEALGQKKPMGQWQTERGDAGRTGVIDFHLSRVFRELASVNGAFNILKYNLTSHIFALYNLFLPSLREIPSLHTGESPWRLRPCDGKT